ncbi:MAG TPA: SDR family oxidoreductase [Puia sp.]|nr:SDR family oxidoreductase [Puia sp.]
MTHALALEGKVVVVTGATGAMGKSFIEGIAEAGGAVGILGRNRRVAEDRATQINLNGGKAMALCADVTNRHDLANARRVMLDTYGKIDGLVNAAGGISEKPASAENIFEGRIDEVKRAMGLHLWGTVLPTLVFGEAMVRHGEGSIVNISSMAARRVVDKTMGYSVAKAAVEAFTKWFAVELGSQYKDAIRINSIAPGCFLTEKSHTHLTNPDGSYTKRAIDIIGHTPSGRLGDPDDLKGALIWLLSDQAKFVTGTTVTVDGGFTANGGV